MPKHSEKLSMTLLTASFVGLTFVGANYAFFHYEPQQLKFFEAMQAKEPATQQAIVKKKDLSAQWEPEGSVTLIPNDDTASVVDSVNLSHKITLNNSDSFMQLMLKHASNGMDLQPYLHSENMVRKFVSFVNEISEGQFSSNLSPARPSSDTFRVQQVGNFLFIDPNTYRRYDLYAEAIENINKLKLIQAYQKMSPLFEAAFLELGYEQNSFEKKLKGAIAEILRAPIIQAPVEVKLMTEGYQFTNPELESLPPIQKLMIRMGPKNTLKIQKNLKEIDSFLEIRGDDITY
ncbi:MAG: DUF3014 domain-containing protein [Shewanellaceae bacterium]|nr:DUF3014 domain-containing protein [Shewanellaceae bacterium]